jgi:hypothetical protein
MSIMEILQLVPHELYKARGVVILVYKLTYNQWNDGFSWWLKPGNLKVLDS